MKINNKAFLVFRLLLIVTFCSSIALGQSQSKFSIGAFYYPAQNHYKIYDETNLGNSINLKPHTGHNFGIATSYFLSPKLSLVSGLGLSDYGYEFEYSGNKGYPKGTYKYKVSYLELPLELQASLHSLNRLNIIVSLGFSIAHYLDKDNKLYVNGRPQGSYDNFDNFDVYAKLLAGVNAGVGIRYNYSDRLSLVLQPKAKFVVNKNTHSFIPNDNEYTHFSSYGAQIILNYKL